MLALDEEVDYLEYQHYLRSQSLSDLYDIASHLDFAACPRRAEATLREIRRRNGPSTTKYADSENLWRKFLMVFIVIAALTQLLASTMSTAEAISPQSPPSLDLATDGDFLQFTSGSSTDDGNQMTASVIGVYAAQVGQNFLRSAVIDFSWSGAFLLLYGLTVYKLVTNLRIGEIHDPLLAEVRLLSVVAFAVQTFILVASPWNHLPQLLNNGHPVDGGYLAHAVTVLAPWR